MLEIKQALEKYPYPPSLLQRVDLSPDSFKSQHGSQAFVGWKDGQRQRKGAADISPTAQVNLSSQSWLMQAGGHLPGKAFGCCLVHGLAPG